MQHHDAEHCRDDEAHLGDRHQHARLAAGHAAQEKDGGAEQHERGHGAVAVGHPRRLELAVGEEDEHGRERHERRGLRHRQGLRHRAVTQPHGVEEIAGAERERRDRDLAERARAGIVRPAFAGRARAHQQPGRQQRQREADDLGRRQRLAEEDDHQQHRDDEVQAENRRVGAERSGRQAADEEIEADKQEAAGERAPQRRGHRHQRACDERIDDDQRTEEPSLHHQEMVGADPRRRSLLVDEIREAVADERRDGEDEGLAHEALCSCWGGGRPATPSPRSVRRSTNGGPIWSPLRRGAQPRRDRGGGAAQLARGRALERIVEKARRTEGRDHGGELLLVIEQWRREREDARQHLAGGMAQPDLPYAIPARLQIRRARDGGLAFGHLGKLLRDERPCLLRRQVGGKHLAGG